MVEFGHTDALPITTFFDEFANLLARFSGLAHGIQINGGGAGIRGANFDGAQAEHAHSQRLDEARVHGAVKFQFLGSLGEQPGSDANAL